MTGGHYRKTSDLPDALAVFPLPGAILFPRWHIPLNIFEPRYLAMIDDVLSGHRLIGMVQPRDESDAPELAEIGCAGRITTYSETDDGRYLITLSGKCRFKIKRELMCKTPYRQVEPDWAPFARDLAAPDFSSLPERSQILTAMRHYAEANSIQADWPAMEQAEIETLINALAAGCPFTSMEKQALIEAGTLRARAETLIKLLEMDIPGAGPTLQ